MADYMVAKDCKVEHECPEIGSPVVETAGPQTTALAFPNGSSSKTGSAYPTLAQDMPSSGPQSSVHRWAGRVQRTAHEWKNHFIGLGRGTLALRHAEGWAQLAEGVHARNEEVVANLRSGRMEDLRMLPPIAGVGIVGTLGRAENFETAALRAATEAAKPKPFAAPSAPVRGDVGQWGEAQPSQIWQTQLVAKQRSEALKASNFDKSSALNEYAKLVGKLIRDTCVQLRESRLLADVIPAWVHVRAGILEQGSHPNLLIGKLLPELPEGLRATALAEREAALAEAGTITNLPRFDTPLQGVEAVEALEAARINNSLEGMRFSETTGKLVLWEQPIVPPAMGHLKAPETPGGVQFRASW